MMMILHSKAVAVLLLLVPPIFGWARSYNTRELSKTLEGDALASAVQSKQDALILFGLLLVAVLASVGAGFVGSSYLLGAFAAGMAFSKLKHPDGSRAGELWARYVGAPRAGGGGGGR